MESEATNNIQIVENEATNNIQIMESEITNNIPLVDETTNTIPPVDETTNTIQVVDEDQFLKLYSYEKCTITDADDLKLQRSVVKDIDGNIVSISLPYTDEYVLNDEVELPEIDLNDYDVYTSMEGTLTRLFYFQDKWYVTTNRKLDGFKSYWSSHFSFGQIFVNNILHVYKETNIESFFEKLDKEQIYFFLLMPTIENRIVCHVDSALPSLYYLGYLQKGKFTEDDVLQRGDELSEISRLQLLEMEDMTLSNVVDHVKGVNVWKNQGVILFHKTKNRQIKLLNEEYKRLWSVRNNNPNLFLRYFEIRTDGKMLEDFFKLYPKFVTVADRFEYQIFEVSKHLHQAYVERYIRKQYVSLPKQEYVILKKAHDWHNKDRDYNRIYRTKMLHLLNDEKPIHLYQIIKRHFKY